jgi:hypothetical protein
MIQQPDADNDYLPSKKQRQATMGQLSSTELSSATVSAAAHFSFPTTAKLFTATASSSKPSSNSTRKISTGESDSFSVIYATECQIPKIK